MKRVVKQFTLLELTVTVFVIMLASGIVFFSLPRSPAKLVLTNCKLQLLEIFTLARSAALSSGKQQSIVYDAEKRCFAGLNKSELYCHDQSISLSTIDDREQLKWLFYSDGSGSGPAVLIESGKAKTKLKLSISKLTGMVVIKDEQNL